MSSRSWHFRSSNGRRVAGRGRGSSSFSSRACPRRIRNSCGYGSLIQASTVSPPLIRAEAKIQRDVIRRGCVSPKANPATAGGAERTFASRSLVVQISKGLADGVLETDGRLSIFRRIAGDRHAREPAR